MRRACLLALFLLGTTAAFGQDAHVTFYSTGSLLAEFSPVTKMAFYGGIFDGEQYLGSFGRHHFMTMSLPPGEHIFSASVSRHPAKNSQLHLNLEPGKSYFVRATEVNVVVAPFSFPRGIIEERICSQAHEEAKDFKPTKTKWIAKQMKTSQVQPPQFPPCDQTN